MVDGHCRSVVGAVLNIMECIGRIRMSAKSGGYAPVLAPELSAQFFAARRKFSAMLAAPEHTIRYYLKPGQLIIFGNRRVLHSRSQVVSDTPRFLQGCYINRDGLHYYFTKSQVLNPMPRYTAWADATKRTL